MAGLIVIGILVMALGITLTHMITSMRLHRALRSGNAEQQKAARSTMYNVSRPAWSGLRGSPELRAPKSAHRTQVDYYDYK